MVTVRSLHGSFAVEIGGIDLAEPLEPAEVTEIKAAIDDSGVTVFRAQTLNDEQQVAFAKLLGVPQISPTRIRPGQVHRLTNAAISDISNLDASGKPRSVDDRRRLRGLANRLWHSDSSFQRPRGQYSMLRALTVPSSGGETEYADLRGAYAALPEDRKAELEGLVAEHSLVHSRGILGFEDFTPEELESHPPVRYPVVWIHKDSQRPTLYLGAHASHILDRPVPEGRILLAELREFATQPHFVYRHRWVVGDLVIWDNRCTMHRGLPYDEREVRDVRRVTTLDLDTADGTAHFATA